jgi:hypothetical protein
LNAADTVVADRRVAVWLQLQILANDQLQLQISLANDQLQLQIADQRVWLCECSLANDQRISAIPGGARKPPRYDKNTPRYDKNESEFPKNTKISLSPGAAKPLHMHDAPRCTI